MKLRDFQAKLKTQIYREFSTGHKRVLAVLPTGGGKTVIFASIVHEYPGIAWVIAHRKELVGQISSALARENVEHGIIGPDSLISYCRQRHLAEFGRPFINPQALKHVVSIDTLTSRKDSLADAARRVNLWVQDEAHHMLRRNKWGAIAELMPNAYGLGVTATPTRADGAGLGEHADGVFSVLVEGPRMRELIEAGYLSEYRIACAPDTIIDVSGVGVSKQTGDYAHNQLVLAVRKQTRLFGNVVRNYQRLAPGKSAIVFATDVQTANDIAEEFRAQGIKAVSLNAKSAAITRDATLAKFRNRDIQVITNVGLFDEGFDVPGVECILDAAPTCSLARFDQKFGRMLRVATGKNYGLYIDFAGNVARHYPPDTNPDINPARRWSLDGRQRAEATDSGIIPSRICPECTAPYPRIYVTCPYCGYAPQPARRDSPEFVDGDLTELDPSILAQLRQASVTDANEVRERMLAAGAPPGAAYGAAKRIRERNRVHMSLAALIEAWGQAKREQNISASEAYRRFYHKFKTDVLTAQTLPGPETEALIELIRRDLY